MSLIKEDWERVFLTDKIYLQQVEYEEELNKFPKKQPAKIILLTPINKKIKNDTLPF